MTLPPPSHPLYLLAVAARINPTGTTAHVTPPPYQHWLLWHRECLLKGVDFIPVPIEEEIARVHGALAEALASVGLRQLPS